jgi:hypothetical protein
MRLFRLVPAWIVTLSAAACASAPEGGENAGLPAWFVEREAKIAAEGKPDLAKVAKASAGNAAVFDRIEAELAAEQARLLADPRAAEPLTLDQARSFDEAARAEVERARR